MNEGVWSGDETLGQIFDIAHEKKRFLTDKLEMQNRAVFHCYIQTPTKR